MTTATQTTQVARAPQKTSALRVLLRRWPVLAGLAAAAFIAFDLAMGVELAKVLAASAVVYIGASAVGRPAAAWPMFFVTVVIITVFDVFKLDIDATWPVLGAGVVMLAYGLLRGSRSPADGLPWQTIALLGFGAAAVVALFANPVVGGFLVAFGLLGHAAWDLYHHRTHKVVTRSLAEFCLVLDTVLAVTIIVMTVVS